MSGPGRRRASLDMTDAPPGSANFFESENGNIDTGKASFEDDGGSGAVPAIDTLKATFDGEDARPSPNGPKTEGSDPRHDLYVLLDEPDSSHLAQAISLVVMLMIFASSVAFVMESTETVKSDPVLKKKMHTLEVVCIIAFSGEYLLRLLCCTARPVEEGTRAGLCNWFWQPMCMVDLVAIAPFWIELFFGGEISLGVLRMLRMTRIFRVLKVGSFAQDLQLFTDGMSRASEGLMLLFFLLLLYFCVFATLLHMFEYEAQIDCRLCPTCGCPAWRGFTSIPNTMYFIMATMTTVGYGDMYPITTMGQIICSFCMFCSIVALGLPIVVVGVAFEATFADADKFKEAKLLEKKKAKARREGMSNAEFERNVMSPEREADKFKIDFDDEKAIVHASQMLYQQFVSTADDRFFQAREVLIKDLPDILFHPPIPENLLSTGDGADSQGEGFLSRVEGGITGGIGKGLKGGLKGGAGVTSLAGGLAKGGIKGGLSGVSSGASLAAKGGLKGLGAAKDKVSK